MYLIWIYGILYNFMSRTARLRSEQNILYYTSYKSLKHFLDDFIDNYCTNGSFFMKNNSVVDNK